MQYNMIHPPKIQNNVIQLNDFAYLFTKKKFVFLWYTHYLVCSAAADVLV